LNQPTLPENVIVLSEEFYREIASHFIQTDLEAVKVLAGALAAPNLIYVAVVLLLCGDRAGISSFVWRTWLSRINSGRPSTLVHVASARSWSNS